MLGAGENGGWTREVGGLEAADCGSAELRNESGVFAEALVGAAPAVVADNGHAGSECPVDVRACDFFRSDTRGGFDDLFIACGSEADVVREDRGGLDVVVPVHGVDAIDERDGQAGLCALGVDAVHEVAPRTRGVVGRIRISAAENGADEVLREVGLMALDGIAVDLGHLADLFLQGHLLKKSLGFLARGLRGGWAGGFVFFASGQCCGCEEGSKDDSGRHGDSDEGRRDFSAGSTLCHKTEQPWRVKCMPS